MAETKVVANRLDQTVPYTFSSTQLGDGTASAPSLAFTSQTNTGLYKSATNSLGFSSNGTKIAEFNATGLTMSSSGGSGLRVYGAAGAHQWDMYLNSNNLRFSDNTGGGIVQVDAPVLISATTPNVAVTTTGTGTVYFQAGANATGAFFGQESSVSGGALVIGSGASNYVLAGAANNPLVLGTNNAIIMTLTSSNVTLTKALLHPDGTAAAPSMSFSANTNTGIFRRTTNAFGLVANGVESLDISAAFVEVMNVPLLVDTKVINASGTAALPAYTFAGDTGTGIYRPAANSMGFSQNGSITWALDGTTSYFRAQGSYGMQAGFASAATPSFGFVSDEDTGMYHAGTNNVGIAANGTLYLQVGVTGAAGAIDSPAVGGFSNTINSPGNAAVFYAINNDTTNANSSAQFTARTTAASNGDPSINWNIASTTNWTMGIDNSDSDALVITEAATLGGVNNRFRMPTGGQMQLSDGSVGAPVLSFMADTSTGLYRAGSSILSIAAGGTEIARFQKGATNVLEMRSSSLIYISDGTSSAPGIAFDNQSTVGMYRPASDVIGLVTSNGIPVKVNQGRIFIDNQSGTGGFGKIIGTSSGSGSSVTVNLNNGEVGVIFAYATQGGNTSSATQMWLVTTSASNGVAVSIANAQQGTAPTFGLVTTGRNHTITVTGGSSPAMTVIWMKFNE